MSVDPNNITFRRLSIYFTFQTEKNVADAFEKLWKVFPDITFQEVDVWFCRFRAGSTNITDDVVLNPNPKSLLNLPPEIIAEIVSYSDVKTFQSLRLVNKQISNTVGSIDRIIQGAIIVVRMTNIEIRYNLMASTRRIVISQNGPTSIVHTNEETIGYGISFMEQAAEEFRYILEKPHTKLDTLEIDCDGRENPMVEIYDAFIQYLAIHLGEKMTTLCIESLKIRASSIDQPLSLLRNIKVGPLTSVQHCFFDTDTEFDMTDFFTLPHWPYIKEFRSITTLVNCPSENFLHIPTVDINIEEADPESLMDHKNTLLNSTILNCHKFNVGRDVAQGVAALLPLGFFEDIKQTTGQFGMANGDRLRMQVAPASGIVMFERKKT